MGARSFYPYRHYYELLWHPHLTSAKLDCCLLKPFPFSDCPITPLMHLGSAFSLFSVLHYVLRTPMAMVNHRALWTKRGLATMWWTSSIHWSPLEHLPVERSLGWCCEVVGKHRNGPSIRMDKGTLRGNEVRRPVKWRLRNEWCMRLCSHEGNSYRTHHSHSKWSWHISSKMECSTVVCGFSEENIHWKSTRLHRRHCIEQGSKTS